MNAAQEQLITDNYRLAPYCVNRYAPQFPMIEREDLFSLAHIGLCDAARDYDAEKGTFANFAINTIIFRYKTERTLRSCQKRKGNPVELKSWMKAADLSDIDFSIDVRTALQNATRGMNERDCRFFYLYYIYGYTLREIGRAEGLSYERVRQVVERIAARFRMFWELAHRKEETRAQEKAPEPLER